MNTPTNCMQDLQALSRLSQALLALLEAYDGKTSEREDLIAELQRHLDEREGLIQQLQHYSEAELKSHPTLNAEILAMEPKIKVCLQKIFADIKASRQLIKSKIYSREKYRNPYASMPFDGAFLDKRK
ncbi:hypothetical protein GCM10011391_13900 [Pullulanibacillus camelliae]|uniref:Flagellar protein FliT n=1 Tax=Pullulanibacillus camelliae TaxID=1707096 RepID=A0A8J2YGN1_9BACL|nr:hypothetical protein [Pullulanibacillus camelliae]GGE36299.1 hypothetical protein GCM10011391_13900 [Pullulanibacillus camelliae]